VGGSHTHSGRAEEITCRIGVAACDLYAPRARRWITARPFVLAVSAG
jgi:hypothetical protein